MNEMNAGGVRQRSVEIVVPVHNEAHVLAGGIGRLHAYLEASFPFRFPFQFGITIGDNASTDATWESARALAERLPHVHTVRLERKGRGPRRAPHIEGTAWFFDTDSRVDIVRTAVDDLKGMEYAS
ncbi:glycosyltransferase [Streptomyces brasiliscabiei]|uniref:glycosyltransferase n=1 Tax=Streptomyces brasiliscabiei TaxID=2736302 RepID=UPI001C0F966F|nr:glycosyltransferase [Streptomyces brasiliscabiei]